MRTITIAPHEECNMLEGCILLDADNVLIIDFVETKVGFKTSVSIGLHEYHGGVTSYEYDYATVEFKRCINNLQYPIAAGEIHKGNFKCFLKFRPSTIQVHNETFKLEYADAAAAAK